MGKREDIELKYRADISQLVSKLSSIEGITEKEAKAMAKALDKGFKKASRSAEKAAKASRAAWKKTQGQMSSTSSTLGAVEDAAGDADSAIMGRSGTAGMLDERFAGAATAAGDLSAMVESGIRIFKSGNPILIAATAAAVAGGLAYAKYTEDVEAHKEMMRVSTEALKTHIEWTGRLIDAQNRLAVVMGDMTADERDLAGLRSQVNKELLEDMQAITPQITAQQEAVNKAKEAWDRSLEPIARNLELTERQQEVNKDLMSAWVGAASIKESTYRKELGLLDELEAKQRAISDAGGGIVDTREQELTTARLIADAAAGEVQIEEERRIAAEKRAAAQAASAEIQQTALQAQLATAQMMEDPVATLEAKQQLITAEYQQQFEELDRLAKLSGDMAAASEAEGLIAAQMQAEQFAAEGEYLAAIQARQDEEIAHGEMVRKLHEERKAQQDDIREKEKEDAEARREEIVELSDAYVSSAASIMGSMSSLAELTSSEAERQAEEAMERSEELREAGDVAAANAAAREARALQESATKAFRRSQGLAAAQVTMDTAMGIVKALADHAGKPYIGIPLSMAMAASGAVQLAQINAQQPPSFHAGGIVAGPSIDATSANLRAGEAVITPAGVSAMGGPSAVHDANRGRSAQSIVVVDTYKHFGMATADELRRPSALRSAIRRASTQSSGSGRRGY